jgi:hypothetical protein
MASFDRFDICAAWNLFLQNSVEGQASKAYERLCRLRKVYKPSRSEEKLQGLSENAVEIYDQLRRKANLEAGFGDDVFGLEGIPIANAGNVSFAKGLYLMWAGESYSATQVYVWANSFEDAFEELVEWLDENAPGRLVSHETAKEALDAYLAEHPEIDQDDQDAMCEVYEAIEQADDWTVIGHTSLNNGGHIASHEWGGDEITDPQTFENVYIASVLDSTDSD